MIKYEHIKVEFRKQISIIHVRSSIGSLVLDRNQLMKKTKNVFCIMHMIEMDQVAMKTNLDESLFKLKSRTIQRYSCQVRLKRIRQIMFWRRQKMIEEKISLDFRI